jgi:hypothetical protein
MDRSDEHIRRDGPRRGHSVELFLRDRRRVEIRGTRRLDDSRIPKTMPRLEGVPLYEDYIPSAYNAASTLEINVTAAGPNVFDFDLKSSP